MFIPKAIPVLLTAREREHSVTVEGTVSVLVCFDIYHTYYIRSLKLVNQNYFQKDFRV